MARCGCVTKCSCVFTAPDDACVEVAVDATTSGCGDTVLTYSVNVLTDDETIFCGPGGLNAAVNHIDTNTVDLEGTGSAGNPLTANVILTPDGAVPDPDATGFGNLINEGAPGIYVSCEDIQDCVGSAIDAVTSDCLEYDDATNTISINICTGPNGIECASPGDIPGCPDGGLIVLPSSDADNALTFGTDGNLFAPSSAIIPGECMTFTGSGTQADPFVISPLVAPELNGVECVPGQGLLVAPSADLGNRLIFGTDQRLWINRCPLVPGGSQVLVGNAGPCFEVTGGDDCVTPILATLRLSDDVCQGLECRPDGLFVLNDQTEEPAPVVQVDAIAPRGPFNGLFPAETQIFQEVCLQLTNPSPCRFLMTFASLSGFVEAGRNGGSFRVTFDIQPNGPGDPWFGVSQVGQHNPAPNGSRGTFPVTWADSQFPLAPGATRTVCTRITFNATDAGQPVTNGRIFGGTRIFTVEGRWID